MGHSHEKRKDSLEGSLDRVLFAAELEFPKIIVPRLPQNTSNVNIEYAGKSYNCILYVDSFLEHIKLSSFYCSDINLFLIDHTCYKIYGCSSLRTTPRFITIQELHTGGKTMLQLLLKIG